MNPKYFAEITLAPYEVEPLIKSLYMANEYLTNKLEELGELIEFETCQTKREHLRIRVKVYTNQIRINYKTIDQLAEYLESVGMKEDFL